jgi:2Fe-2S ferredoxin
VTRIEVAPLGAVFELDPTETLIEAAWRAGYYWPTVCGGRGECGVCRCEIVAGAASAAPMEPRESRLLTALGAAKAGKTIRLACQLKAAGNLKVLRPGMRKKD